MHCQPCLAHRQHTGFTPKIVIGHFICTKICVGSSPSLSYCPFFVYTYLFWLIMFGWIHEYVLLCNTTCTLLFHSRICLTFSGGSDLNIVNLYLGYSTITIVVARSGSLDRSLCSLWLFSEGLFSDWLFSLYKYSGKYKVPAAHARCWRHSRGVSGTR